MRKKRDTIIKIDRTSPYEQNIAHLTVKSDNERNTGVNAVPSSTACLSAVLVWVIKMCCQ